MKRLDEKGQALVEFFVFLPFMLIMYAITITIANAINGSINQQKIVRGYFFNIVQNDSMIPSVDQLAATNNLTGMGMLAFGWKNKFVGTSTPEAPCYKVKSIIKKDEEDLCSDVPLEDTTQYIRVKTAFGVCSNTYAIMAPGFYMHNMHSGSLFNVNATFSACTNMQ